mgnify:CR=1 FL=1|jgi:hypothetical protein
MNNIFKMAKEAGTDKAQHGYLDVYNELFQPIHTDELNFLEIGVYQGASAKLWASYFNNSNVFMTDIFDKKNILKDLDVNFFRGDSANEDDLCYLMEYVKEVTEREVFDVIIDDGSHFQYDQMTTLGLMFPRLSSGGIYIIEDICYEEDLRTGSMWWGHTAEPHHSVQGECHFGSALHTDEEWLGGDQIDYSNSTDATMKRFVETGIIDSPYLSYNECQYIMKETFGVYLYDDTTLSCRSKLAVIRKK